MIVSQRPGWIRSAENQVFERKKGNASMVDDDGGKDKQATSSGINNPNGNATNEPRISLNMEEGSSQNEPGAGTAGAAISIQEMHDAELSELQVADEGDAPQGSDGDPNSVTTLGNKKKNKVYAAPSVEELEFHEA